MEPGAFDDFHPPDSTIAGGPPKVQEPLVVKVATVQQGGKVEFEDSDAKDFIR